ncbi:MAG: hypothetical protein DRQ55_01035 [Planctomycetota bacterium]|nr:MAG: hypothetical protein DRQ55_01035 [Planctomycetota bacterium]
MSAETSSRTCAPARGLLALLLLLLVQWLGGCSSIETQHRDWSEYDGPGAEWFQLEEPEFFDPMADDAEPFNRSMFAFNDGFMRYVISPLGRGWRFVFRQPVRDAFSRFGTNLQYPVRAVNNAVQGEGGATGRESARFLINLTVGLLGFFDPATPMGVAAAPNDTGRSLTNAGWEQPRFLTLPGVGPSSTRDGVGWVGDSALSIEFWLWPVGFFTRFNELAGSVENYKRLVDQRYDAYELTRYAWSIMRLKQVVDMSYDDADPGAARETLNAIFLGSDDPGFLGRTTVHEPQLPGRPEPLPYNLWLQPDPAPLVFVVPGLGSHRSNDTAVALAELFHGRGWSVVSISSTMHPEFMRGAGSHSLPGYSPLDAADLRAALAAINRDLATRHPDAVTSRALVGVSMGAFHTMLVAAGVGARDDGLQLDGYLALETPVDLLYGVELLDGFYRAPMQLAADEREEKINNVLQKVAHLLLHDQPEADRELPFSEWEAEYLIGVAFRLTLVSVIFDSQLRDDRGVLLTPIEERERGAAYREIVRYSFMEYVFAWLIPSLLERDDLELQSPDEIFELSRLQHWGEQLAANPDVRVIANENDFLTNEAHQLWLQQTLGPERVILRPMGGHLGNLSKPEVQAEIVDVLAELLGERRGAGGSSGP